MGAGFEEQDEGREDGERDAVRFLVHADVIRPGDENGFRLRAEGQP